MKVIQNVLTRENQSREQLHKMKSKKFKRYVNIFGGRNIILYFSTHNYF